MYSGTALGDMGDLYIPFDNGNFIKVAKKTNSQISAAAASAVYFDADGTELDMKFVSNSTPNANSTFSVSPTYGSLMYYQPLLGSEVRSAASVTVTVHFIAVGY